jgi:hypothetical protein
MQIRARMSMSADRDVPTPSGGPALTADPAFLSGESTGSASPRGLRGGADGPDDGGGMRPTPLPPG